MKKSNKQIHQLKAAEIHMRDPFIFPDKKEGYYYLYGTTDVADGAANIDPFFEVYRSKDLLNFEGPYAAFVPEKGFWGVKHFWAPEVHFYQGRYYMFASCKGGIGEDRGTCILAADHPGGPFYEHSQGPVTLRGHECLDGTLYIDRQNQPWIVFCHEWTEIYYGRILALPLKPDLSGPIEQEPIVLVDTEKDNLPWLRQMRDNRVDKVGYLTDAPYFYRTKAGTLLLLWSSYSVKNYSPEGYGGYVVAMVKSLSGEIQGPWEHLPRLLLDQDIGHISLFERFDGALMLAGHNHDTRHGSEHPIFLPLKEQGEELFLT